MRGGRPPQIKNIGITIRPKQRKKNHPVNPRARGPVHDQGASDHGHLRHRQGRQGELGLLHTLRQARRGLETGGALVEGVVEVLLLFLSLDRRARRGPSHRSTRGGHGEERRGRRRGADGQRREGPKRRTRESMASSVPVSNHPRRSAIVSITILLHHHRRNRSKAFAELIVQEIHHSLRSVTLFNRLLMMPPHKKTHIQHDERRVRKSVREEARRKRSRSPKLTRRA